MQVTVHLPVHSRPLPRALAALALLAASAMAAPAPVFENSMAQRMLACSACHGAQGRASPDGYYPRLAGKPAGYLYNQLLNFRDDRRHYGLMVRLVDPLSDAYLLKIAQYFSGLNLPYPPPSAQPARVAPELLRRGQALTQRGDPERRIPACMQCHGERLTGVAPNIPGLLGLPMDYLNAQLGAWRTGQRRAHAPDCMAQIVERMRPDDVVAVSSWLSHQPLPADTHPATALPPLAPGTPAILCGSAPAPLGSAR